MRTTLTTGAFVRVAIAILTLTGFATVSGSLAWADVTVSPMTLSFGRVQVNKSKSMSVTVTGGGPKTTHVKVSVSGPFTAKPTSFDVKKGEKRHVAVTLRPTKVGVFKNTLHVNKNSVSLTGDSFAGCVSGGKPPCYFIAIRLIDQSGSTSVANGLEKHLKKLSKHKPKGVFVYKKSDIHISLQSLTQTSPLNTNDKGRLKAAMAAVKALDICGPIKSGNFEVWDKGNIVYHIVNNGGLTGLMTSVITNLNLQKLGHTQRQDFPDKGHYTVGSYGDNLRSYLNKHFKPWKGQKVDKTGKNPVYYMKPPSCKIFVPASLSLMIRVNPGVLPPHYRRDQCYPLLGSNCKP